MQEPLLGRPQLLGVLVGKAPQQILVQEGLRRLQETEMREPFIKECGVYIDSFSTKYLFQRRFVLVCPMPDLCGVCSQITEMKDSIHP